MYISVSDNPFFVWEKPGILRYILCSLISCVFFWILLMMIEYNWIQKVSGANNITNSL